MASDEKELLRRARYAGRTADGEGCVFYSSFTPEASKAGTLCQKPPEESVPVIFIPGIMGSNLKSKVEIKDAKDKVILDKDRPVWRGDSILGMFWEWFFRGKEQYQLRLQSEVLEVDDGGDIPYRVGGVPVNPVDLGMRPDHTRTKLTPLSGITVEEAKARGWGEVFSITYFGFLDWLQREINCDQPNQGEGEAELRRLKASYVNTTGRDAASYAGLGLKAEEIDVLGRYQTPVYAFGYNWLGSNREAGKALAGRIKQVIERERQQGNACEKVMLMTHSMGGLVARAACKLEGMEGDVLGVFHSVMPTDGAAAAYKRMVSGFGGEGGGIEGWVSARVLGPRGEFLTPVFAMNGGPLELLPNKRYNNGQAWLLVKDKDGKEVLGLPQKGDPYGNIYSEKSGWWKLFNEEWLNPANLPADGSYFPRFRKLIDTVEAFHDDLTAAGDFHANTYAHYGASEKTPTFGAVVWKLEPARNDAGGEVDAAVNAALRRADFADSDMSVRLQGGRREMEAEIQAAAEAGDGTVPETASAARVAAVAKNPPKDTSGFEHDKSYSLGEQTGGPHLAIQAAVRMLSIHAGVTPA